MNRTMFSLVRIMMCGLFLLFAVTVQAQFKAGIQGTVTDTAGGRVPDATITLTNKETSKTKTVTSSDEGFYRFNQLAPGNYGLTAEKSGFKKQVLENVVVSAEDVQGIDLLLTPGEVSEIVTVTETSTAALETENGSLKGTITTQEILRQPQVGRNPYELLRLAPGVLGDTARRGGSANRAQFLPGTEELGGASNTGVFQTENQPQVSANGQRVSSNNYMIDGVSVNSLGLGGAAVVTPNQESVKEISIVTSSYSAEDGRNTGAQVKVVSQNGTNQFHGSAVLNYGSPKLNSFNKFFGPTNIPATLLTCLRGTKVFASRCPEIVNQYERKFAGSLGGPIYLPRFGEGGPAYFSGKNKLFFFVSYEGLRRNNITTNNVFLETPEFRDYVIRTRPGSLAAQLFSLPGIVPRVVGSGLTPSNRPNGTAITGQAGLSFDIGSINRPIGQKIFTQTLDGIPDVTFASVAVPVRTTGNQYNARVDYNRKNDQFAVSTYFTKLENFAGSPTGRPFEDTTFKPVNSAATFTWIRTINAKLLNEARFNFTRFNDDEFSALLARGNLFVPRLEINGFTFVGEGFNFGLGAGQNFGVDPALPKKLTQNTYEIRDTVTYVRGNQAFKIGGEARREQDNSNRTVNARPRFNFDNILSFANDAPFFEFSSDVDPRTGAPPNSQFYFRSNSYGAFIQDDWKVRPNLTFNLGLRYEYQSPLTEKNNRLTNYIFGPNGIVDGRVVPVKRLYDPDRNNFAPRVGFAWQPNFKGFGEHFAGGRTVIRGGFGIGYDRIFENLVNNSRFNPPFSAAAAGFCCGTATDPDGTGGIVYGFAPPGTLAFPANPGLRFGIDPVTGGLLAASPQTLPGGFIRRDIPVEINGSPKHLPNSYVYNYSLELQYQVTSKLVASLSYVGSMGRKLIRTIDLNRFTPGDTFNCVGCENRKDEVQEADANGNRVTPRLVGNPNFDRIFFPLPDVNSSYNSMVLSVIRRYTRGFQIDGTYRWSKSIDTNSFGRGAQQTDPSNQKINRGPSDFDVRHNLIISALWDIPLFRERKDFIGKALGGFQINGIFDLHSGFPWTPQQGCCFFDRAGDFANDANGDGKGNDFPTQYFGGIIAHPSNQDFINGLFPNGGRTAFGVIEDCNNFPVRCVTTIVRGPAGVGRNSFRGPKYRSLDLSVVKQTRLPGFLGEGANLEVRANFFNAFNLLNLPPFQTGGQSNTDFTNRGDFGRSLFGLAGRVIEFQARFSF
ncbi:MAG TPA: TonB-dependent receptor [Pyrinomonadaceae bacterium]|nr:TonB-dependent receptor [Pyrinomonadaceae bacterium]